ncbi:PAS domain S-box protein [Halovenus salina]|nr:PAS domain S-box protein [Halovenus salina]
MDTDTAVSGALAETLEKRKGNFEIVSETDPQDALARLTTTDFDCVVSGYDLPDMTGIQLLNAIRENDERLPVILFTGEGSERVASRAISAGVTDYIRKRSGDDGIDALATRVQELGDAGQTISETNARYDIEQFERFLEAFPDAVFVMDENGRHMDYITGGDRSLLYDDIDELLGQRYHDVLADETADRFLDTIQQALETGKQQQIEYQLDVKGGMRWFEAHVGPLDMQAEPRTVFWIARDITERKRREQEYEQIFNGVPNPLTVNDPETGELLEVNDAMCEILGYEKETILGKGNDWLAVNEEGFSGQRAANIVTNVMESSEPRTFEWKLEAADGSHRVLEVTGTPAEINGEERYISLTRDITERRQREREYEQIFNNVNDAIAVFDPATGDIVDVNEAYREMLGYDDLDTICELGIEGLSASDEGFTGERGWELIRAVSQSGEPETVEWRGETSDGDRLWLEATLAPAEIGGQDRVLSIQRDVTERRELERTYRDIFENVSDGLVIHDPTTGDILEVNERYCELTGYEREELLDGTVRQIMLDDPDHTYEEVITRIKRAREEGPQLFEFKAEKKNGERFVADVHLRTIEMRGEERVLASVRDITERKRRKQEYEQIFHGVNDIITIHDPETAEILDVNDTFCELLGYDRETILDMGITGYSPAEDGYSLEQARQFVQEVIESDEPKQTEWAVETRSGEIRWLDVKGTTVEIGGEQQYVSISRDVTERRRREREYEQIFNNVNDSIAVHDRDTGELLNVNRRMCELTGYDKETVLELGAEGLIHDHPAQDYAPEEIPSIIERVMSGEEIEPYEQVLETSDGGFVWVEVNPTRAVIGGEERFVAISRDVTERRRRELEYEQIFNNVNDIIAVRDPESGEIIDVNQSYADLLGYDREEMQGMTISEVGVPDEGYDGEQGMEHLKTVVESDDPVEFEWKVEGADGKPYLMDVRGTAALINGNQRYLAIGRDITERKRRERAINSLRRATERLQSAMTPEEVATVAVETASEVLDLPMAVCWFHDEDTERLAFGAATENIHDVDLASEISADQYEYDVFVEGAVTEYTPREQAGHKPFETGVLLPLAGHGLIAAVTRHDTRVDETVLDIAKALADHVTTALDRVERDRAVRESERRFRLIADRVDEIIYLADANTQNVLYLSPGHEEIWGRSLDDIYEDPETFTEAIHPDDIDSFIAARQEIFADIDAGKPADSYEFSYRIERPDGEVRWIETSAYPILSDDDRPDRYVALIKDVTDRKYREQRLEVFNRILRHNLRNQLDVIRSHAEVLADQGTDDHAERIIAAVDDLATIGSRARKSDRIMSMNDPLTEVNLTETVRDAVEAMASTRGDVSVTTEAPRDALLTTNEDAMLVAVESALENAIAHAESTVTVVVEESTAGYVVTINDDGPGIPDEELVPIEARSETNLQHSRGLGLWQLRWSVDKLNGELSFDTGDGTAVRITITDQEDATQTR